MSTITPERTARGRNWRDWIERMKASPNRWHLVEADAPDALARNLKSRRLAPLRAIPDGVLHVVTANTYRNEYGEARADVYALWLDDPAAPLPPSPKASKEIVRGIPNRKVRLPKRVAEALKSARKDRGDFPMNVLAGDVIRHTLEVGTDFRPDPEPEEEQVTVYLKVTDDEWQAFTDLAALRGVENGTLARYELAKLAATIDSGIDPMEVVRGR